MPVSKKYFGLIGKVSAAFLLTISTGSMEAAWTTPTAISSSNSDQVQVIVAPAGDAVAVWQGYDGINYVIQSSSLPFGGSWSSFQTLSAPDWDAQAPSVAVDRLGNAVSVWSRFDGNYSIVQGAKLPYGGSWSAPVNISSSGANADSPKIAMDDLGTIGNAVAVWHRFNGTNFIVQSSELHQGGSWSPATNITPSGQDALIPNVAVDPNGNALAICARYDGTDFTSRSAIALQGENWGPSFVISEPGLTVSGGSLSLDFEGDGTMVWSQFDGANFVIQASVVPYGGSASAPQTLSLPGQDAYTPMIDADLAGHAVVVWVRFDGSNYIAQSVTRQLDGSWSTPVDLSHLGVSVVNVGVAVDVSGNAVAIWDETDGTNFAVYSAGASYNGTWSAPANVSTPGNYAYRPSVAIDSSGNAVAIWLEFDGTDSFVWGSSLSFGG